MSSRLLLILLGHVCTYLASAKIVIPLQSSASSSSILRGQIDHLLARQRHYEGRVGRSNRQLKLMLDGELEKQKDQQKYDWMRWWEPFERELDAVVDTNETTDATDAKANNTDDTTDDEDNEKALIHDGDNDSDNNSKNSNNTNTTGEGNVTTAPTTAPTGAGTVGGNDTDTDKTTNVTAAPTRAPTKAPTVPSPATTTNTNTTTVRLSNCHMYYYTAQVQIGSPIRQTFTLVMDTSSTDLWVPSTDCNDFEGCYVRWRKFNASLSQTFQPLNKNYADNIYENDKFVGQKVQDTVYLTDDLTIPKQAFALVDKQLRPARDDGECSGWDGFLGLGPTSEGYSDVGFPEDMLTVLGNIKRQQLLENNMLSVYLDETDDYPPFGPDDSRNEPAGVIPQQSSSEMVLGGVKQSHYKGCLHWHDLHPYMTLGGGGEPQDIFWNFDIEKASVGGIDLPDSDLAILDTRAAISIGSPGAIALVALQNQMTCFWQDPSTGTITKVSCNDPFELAYTRCDRDDIEALDFLVDGVVYSMDKDVLLIPIAAAEVGEKEDDNLPDGQTTWCLLSLVPILQASSWILGANFLKEYYTVLNFGNFTVGLAPRRRPGEDRDDCPADARWNVEESNTPAAPPGPTANTAAPTTEPIPGSPSTPSVPTKAPAVPVPTPSTAAPTPKPHTNPHHPHSAPHPSAPHYNPPHAVAPDNAYKPSEETSSSDGSSPGGSIALAFLVVVALFSILFCWRRRRQRAQYSRASYYDDYRFGGDMELAEIS